MSWQQQVIYSAVCVIHDSHDEMTAFIQTGAQQTEMQMKSVASAWRNTAGIEGLSGFWPLIRHNRQLDAANDEALCVNLPGSAGVEHSIQ